MNIDTIKKRTKEYLLSLPCDDFLYNEEDKKRQQEQLLKAETLSQCLSIIRRRDRFDYLYFLYQLGEITDQECADAVYSIWTMQEKVYNCGICITKIIKFMHIATKSPSLQSDIDGLSNDNMITIYRGVDVNNYKGLSWTIDKRIAEWFAKRFVTNGEKCYVFTGKINKKEILAVFNCRNEKEVVCDYRKIKDIQCEEIMVTDKV